MDFEPGPVATLARRINLWLRRTARSERGELWLAHLVILVYLMASGVVGVLLVLLWRPRPLPSVVADVFGAVCLLGWAAVLMLFHKVVDNIRCRECGEAVFRTRLFATYYFRFHCPSCGRSLMDSGMDEENPEDETGERSDEGQEGGGDTGNRW